MKEILYMDVTMFEDKALFEQGMSMISAERMEKIRKFKNPVPARLSLGAGVLLYFALDRYGLAEKKGKIKTGEYGKPYLEGEDFHFSLSHSGHYAICAVSSTPIGVDLQQIKEKLPMRTTKILTEAEKIYLEEVTETERAEIFYRLWARKESLIKWDGRGLRLPLEQVSFVKDGILVDKVKFEGKILHFKEYQELLPQYAICICNETGNFSEIIEEITAESLKNP
ncbi:4'-phosphopantetheinyl transferase family protein [Anaerotignum sp.]|nr:4'-phosphopantetheinyl transferase superfamily protein [Anaerotignum sp.]MBQ7757621.1 4'-phosphopantetheinyl transferase superfamily protein [Anaerotignum sp.]